MDVQCIWDQAYQLVVIDLLTTQQTALHLVVLFDDPEAHHYYAGYLPPEQQSGIVKLPPQTRQFKLLFYSDISLSEPGSPLGAADKAEHIIAFRSDLVYRSRDPVARH